MSEIQGVLVGMLLIIASGFVLHLRISALARRVKQLEEDERP